MIALKERMDDCPENRMDGCPEEMESTEGVQMEYKRVHRSTDGRQKRVHRSTDGIQKEYRWNTRGIEVIKNVRLVEYKGDSEKLYV